MFLRSYYFKIKAKVFSQVAEGVRVLHQHRVLRPQRRHRHHPRIRGKQVLGAQEGSAFYSEVLVIFITLF